MLPNSRHVRFGGILQTEHITGHNARIINVVVNLEPIRHPRIRSVWVSKIPAAIDHRLLVGGRLGCPGALDIREAFILIWAVVAAIVAGPEGRRTGFHIAVLLKANVFGHVTGIGNPIFESYQIAHEMDPDIRYNSGAVSAGGAPYSAHKRAGITQSRLFVRKLGRRNLIAGGRKYRLTGNRVVPSS